jgi:hypothetical protein
MHNVTILNRMVQVFCAEENKTNKTFAYTPIFGVIGAIK